MRINKYLASAGVASRRKSEELIIAGRVFVNGEVMEELSYKVQPIDIVAVDGNVVAPVEEKIILALHKPRGVTSTVSDPHADQTVVDFVPQQYSNLVPAGRLDKDSVGLILLSNDGDFIYTLTHPSFEHEKEYYVEVQGTVTDAQLKELSEGIRLEEGNTGKNSVQRKSDNAFMITLHQGWNRQVRRMAGALGLRVKLLQRVRIGKLSLGDLKEGEVKRIDKSDIF